MWTGTITLLAIPAVIFVGIHTFISGTPVRGVVVGVIGTRAYLGLFSLGSLAGLMWMILSYRDAPFIPVWHAPALAWVGILVMPVALLFAIAAYTTKTPPPSEGAEGSESRDLAVGIGKVTRHPFLWSVVLWSAAHLIVNGDVASLILFGAFLILGLVGPHSIDAKQRRKDPEAWARLNAVTSNLPFAAVLGGRTRVSLSEIGWWRIGVAAVLYVALLIAHGWIFGAPALT